MDSPFTLYSDRAEGVMQSQLGKFLGCDSQDRYPIAVPSSSKKAWEYIALQRLKLFEPT